jgi:hypothetical protein
MIGYVPFVRSLGPSSDPLASPAVVENYIKTWGGSLGGAILKAADWSGSKAGVFPPQIDKADPWERNIFLSRFVSHFPDFQDQRVTDFYANKDAADKAYNSVQAAAKAGDFEAAQRLMAAHPEFQDRLSGISKSISEARKTYEMVKDDPKMPVAEKGQLTNTILFQIGSMAKMGNQMMQEFRDTAARAPAPQPQTAAAVGGR